MLIDEILAVPAAVLSCSQAHGTPNDIQDEGKKSSLTVTHTHTFA